ncbi:hypothetical protein [Glycomyces sp. MUSA5-2]|uniref:hypothetical protein n=1 Tax=Glycomyces sp. MUSA5-2 TaxID=2053002 RepID=UPI00300AA436
MTRLAYRDPYDQYRTPATGVDPAPAMRARIGTAIAAVFGCIVMIVGIPLFLYFVVGSRWPSRWPVEDDFSRFNLYPTGELILGVLAVLGWALWGIFVLLVLHGIITSTVDAIRWGVRAETWRDASNPVRWVAGLLIGAVAALWPATAHAATEPVEPANTTRELTADELAAMTATGTAEAPTAAECAASDAPPVADAEPAAETPEDDHERNADGLIIETVDSDPSDPSDDTLWGMAEEHYGDGNQYGRIFDYNEGLTQSNGLKLTDADHIVDGTEIAIPGTATPADATEPAAPETEDAEPEPSDPETAIPPLQPETETDTGDPDAPADADPEPAPAAPDQSADPTDPGSAPDLSDEPETEAGEAADALPIGVWIGAGTFLAALTIAAFAKRLRKQRRQRTAPSDQRLTGRLADIEAAVAEEDHHLARLGQSAPGAVNGALTIATDLREPIDLRDVAQPAVGLLGPGQAAAARAAVASALLEGTPVVITAAAVQYCGLHDIPEATLHRGLHLIDGFSSPVPNPQEAPGPRLLVCAEPDLDGLDEATLSDLCNRNRERALVLSGDLDSTMTLAADGTVLAATGHSEQAEARQCYIAEPAVVELAIRSSVSETRTTRPYWGSAARTLGDFLAAIDQFDDLINVIDWLDPAIGLNGPFAPEATRVAVASTAAAGGAVVLTPRAAVSIDGGCPWPPECADLIAPDLPTAIDRAADRSSQGATSALVVCTEADLDKATDPQFGERDITAIILGDWPDASLTFNETGEITDHHGVDLPGRCASFPSPPEQMMEDLALAQHRGPGISESDLEPDEDAPANPGQVPQAAPAEPEPIDKSAPARELRLCVFGYPGVYLDEKPVPLKQGRRALAILTALALDPDGNGCTKDALLFDALDGEPMSTAKHYFTTIINDTRGDLSRAAGIEKTEERFIVYDKRTRRYHLEQGRFAIDRDEFDRLEQDAALAKTDDERAELLAQAVSLYAGDLADQMDIETATDLRSQYRSAVSRASRVLVEYYEAQHDSARADLYRRAVGGD